MRADQRIEGRLELTMNTENVSCVAQCSASTGIQEQNVVQDHAPRVYAVKICAIRKLPPRPVYNMEVETHHNFAVNGGLIVHNCIDAVRYATERIWKRPGNGMRQVYHSPFGG